MAVNYKFPLIEHIDDVLPYIDSDCFRVNAKDCGNTYINYVKMGNDTFPLFNGDLEHDHRAAIRRECRGIAFDTHSGDLVSRPFHKFFNLCEREDMDLYLLNFDAPHVVHDKVDGSMIRPIPTPDGLRWGTKAGLTDTSVFAETWLIDHPKYERFAEVCRSIGYTPIFEYVSPENRVVVNYGGRNMTLLAMRDNLTGHYMPHMLMKLEAEELDIPVVKLYDPVEGDPRLFLASVKESDDLDEGVVIWWQDGGAAKCKTDIYNVLHKVKEAGRTERTLVTAIFEGKVDDLLPLLPDEDRAKVTGYVANFWHCVHVLGDDIFTLYNKVRAEYDTKKDFAIRTAKTLTQLERATVFSMWDGKFGATDGAINIVKGGLASETKWAEMKQNIAKASSFHDFDSQWDGTEDDE